jgi:uncharacterized protein (DUF302 family)
MRYGSTKKVDVSYVEAVARTKEELKKEGFGILTEIDVKATLKKKLDVDFDNYTILGACNPSLAHQALQTEKEIGLLLPCNVMVYEEECVFVSAIKPSVAMGMVENDGLREITQQVEEKMKKVVNAI